VRAALERDPRIRHTERIAMSADEIGTVVLHGAVESLPQRLAAKQDARQVEGVFNVVIDDLKVHPPVGARPGEDAIRAAAQQRVILDSRIRSNHIHVKVSHGWVTLTGYVRDESERAAAMACYEILTYGVYMLALAGAGWGLWFGVFSGPHPLGLILIPAATATAVILAGLSMLWVYEPVERFLERRSERSKGRAVDRWRRAVTLPRTIHVGLRAALGMLRRGDPSVLGAVAYWGFDIGALWASFRAFGHSPPGAVLVTGYYVGTLGTALPLPGGIGGVEGDMIGAFIGFGVEAPLATIAVLAYRTISYWLPTIPGVIAYFHLRHDVGTQKAGGSEADE
jgi:Lysylphosphatidylglycerol synthase TM region/BON domain